MFFQLLKLQKWRKYFWLDGNLDSPIKTLIWITYNIVFMHLYAS